jgi:phosphatidylglycerol:prolipoprotein diacylglycerol transferase
MIAFSLFGRPVYRYGIMYMMSFLLGYGFLWYVTSRQLITKVSPTLQAILTDRVDTLLTYIIIGGILGGRLGEVFFYERGYYSQHLGEILQTRQGGMSFVGGIIGALVAVSLFLGFSRPRDTDKKSWLQTLLTLTDLIAVITPLGIMLGRIGNFLNRELYGPIVINLTTLSSRQTPRSFDGSWPFERVSDGVLGIQ